MIPLSLLALAVHPDSPLNMPTTISLRRAIAVELAILGLLIVHLVVFRRGDILWRSVPLVPNWFATPFGINTYVAVGIATLALVSVRFVRVSWFRWPVFLLVLLMGYSSVPVNFPLPNTTRAREDFGLTVAVHDFIYQHLDFNRKISMWYSLKPGELRPYRGISSTYLWAYVVLNEAMPSLERSTLMNKPDDQTRLILMATNDKEIDVARQSLLKAGYRYEPVVQQEFGPRDATFQVVIGDLFHTGDADATF